MTKVSTQGSRGQTSLPQSHCWKGSSSPGEQDRGGAKREKEKREEKKEKEKVEDKVGREEENYELFMAMLNIWKHE